MSLNKVLLMGRLGADPELRYTQSQTPICTFRLATTERRRGADGNSTEQTEWHTVVTFGKTAELCNQYLQKGRMAFIEGRIQTRKYQDQDGKDKFWTEIIANSVQFIGGRSEGDRSEFNIERSAQPSSGSRSGGFPAAGAGVADSSSSLGDPIPFDDDDIPF